MGVRKMFKKTESPSYAGAKSRRRRYGAAAIAVTVLAVAVVIMLNVLLTLLTERYPLSLDLTKNNIYELSEDTVAYLDGVDKEVKIHILSTEQSLSYSYDYLDLVQAAKTIEAYAKYSEYISVDYVDLASNPGFINAYPDSELRSYDVIVESGSTVLVTNLTDMFEYSYQYNEDYTGYEIAATSKVEQEVTNAIMYAFSGVKPKIGFLTGFGEGDSSDLQSLLSKNNYEAVAVNLLTEDIPKDISALVWFGAEKDPTDSALTKLDAYLESGGSLLIFTDPFIEDQPNFDAFLSEWGLSIPEAFAFETDSSRIFNNSMYYPLVEYTDSSWSSGLEGKNSYTLFYAPRPVETLFGSEGDISTSILLSLSESSGRYPADVSEDYQITDEDMVGNVPVAALAQSAETGGRLFVFGSTYSFQGEFLTTSAAANAEYITGIFAILSERENSAVIAPKDVSTQNNTMTTGFVMASSAVFVILIPLLLIGAGGAVYLKRRRK